MVLETVLVLAALLLFLRNQWDYTRLKLAPCRYTGSVKTGSMVIAAHNYARHFGRLFQLLPGDRVLLTEMLAPTQIEEMTGGDYSLTLFTCTYGGQSRVTVRCDRVSGG